MQANNLLPAQLPQSRTSAPHKDSTSLIVLWRVFTFCNLDCAFCAYAKSQKIPRPSVAYSDIQRMGQLLNKHKQTTGSQIMVSWLGGEPFLWKELERASQLYYSLGLNVSLTTNGTQLSKSAARDFVVNYVSEITISLDVHHTTHDRFRGYPTFSSIVESTRQLIQLRNQKQAPTKIRVNAILMRDNVKFVTDFIVQLDQIGVDEVTFNELGGIERPDFWEQHRLEPAHIQQLMPQLYHARPRYLKVLANPKYLERLQASAESRKLPISNCRAISRLLFIDEHGRMGPCPFMAPSTGAHISSLQTPADLPCLESKFRQAQGGKPCLDCKSTLNFGKFDK
jgi:sulfatase maturation enzyme AslB (radical SAM superfamily)